MHHRNITPLGPDELDAFTIQSQYEKLKKKYPFIQPVVSRPNYNGVNAYYDILYKRSPSSELYLDIFTPQKEPRLRPAVVFVHGGAWRTGHRTHHNETASYLATQNFVGVTIDYRLSREALYPAALHDISDAIEWLRKHHTKYGIDPNKIVISGSSSGAHLASVIATHNDQYAPVQGLINIDGVPDLTSKESRAFEDNPNKASYAALWLGGRYHQLPKLWEQVSPILHVDKATPPTLFINSSNERFHTGREVFIKQLNEFNTFNNIHTIEDTPHPFWLFYPWVDSMRQYMVEFLNNVFEENIEINSQFLNLEHSVNEATTQHYKLSQWRQYLANNQLAKEKDEAYMQRELKQASLEEPIAATKIKKVDSKRYWEMIKDKKVISLSEINNMISWQAPNGGWSKNTDFYSSKRKLGQHFGREPRYISTIDNGATILQIFQLKLALKTYKEIHIANALHRAINFLINAQYPNGGLPQVYPLVGGYHDLVTYNDDALSLIFKVFDDLVHHPQEYKLSSELLTKVTLSFHQLINRFEQDQVKLADGTGAWGQQHHPLDFSLQAARAYEMPSLATMETAKMIDAMMDLKTSMPSIDTMISQGCKWLDKTKMSAKIWRRYPNKASEIVAGEIDDIIWPRFISATTGAALFGDRDGKIYDSVDKISLERQLGYAWYHASPNKVLKRCREKE
jgi:PelA/Pel-15E family pectate lyase